MNRYLRTFVEIDVDAIEHNLDELKKCINENIIRKKIAFSG